MCFPGRRDGLAGAFRHPTVTDAILGGRYQRIAVAVTQWAGEGEQARRLMAQHIEHGYLSVVRALEDGHWGKVKNWEGDERELPDSLYRRIRMLEMGF